MVHLTFFLSAKRSTALEQYVDGATEACRRIEYGGRGSVQFDTVGAGYLGPSPMPEVQRGVINWRITSGDGEFQGAQGHITSNFTVGASGNVVDNHYVRMVLP